MHPRVVSVEIIPPYGLRLSFTDGTSGTIDAASWVRESQGVFAELRDPRLFAQARVDPELETIVWPNHADVDPETLYEEAHRRLAGES